MKRAALLLAGLALSGGGAEAVRAAWVPAKAAVAQVLLRSAWSRSRATRAPSPPWPWADTWPVARLVAPRLGVDRIVLAGATGEALAFGPGHLEGTAAPGATGHCVLAGHRDTSFAFLARLELGDELRIEGPDGRERVYRVACAEVAHEREMWRLGSQQGDRLTLLTCWPLDSPAPGGPMRYLVTATPAPPRTDGPRAPDRAARPRARTRGGAPPD